MHIWYRSIVCVLFSSCSFCLLQGCYFKLYLEVLLSWERWARFHGTYIFYLIKWIPMDIRLERYASQCKHWLNGIDRMQFTPLCYSPVIYERAYEMCKQQQPKKCRKSLEQLRNVCVIKMANCINRLTRIQRSHKQRKCQKQKIHWH